MSLVGVLGVVSCSRQAAPPAKTNQPVSQAAPPAASRTLEERRPPAELVQIGESAEALFDEASASKWNDAAASVQAMKESVAALKLSALESDLVARLPSRINDAADSVTARQRVQSMDVANSLTRLVADLSSPFQDDIPYKILLLDYYGRQLELGIAASRPSTLTQATVDLRQTWNSIEPAILRRGQVDEARRFTDVVVQLEGAKHPADFVAPVRAELAAVDRLETMFKQ